MITSQITMLRGCFHSVNNRTVVQLPLAASHRLSAAVLLYRVLTSAMHYG